MSETRFPRPNPESPTVGYAFITGQGDLAKHRFVMLKSVTNGGFIGTQEDMAEAVMNIVESFPKSITDEEIGDGHIYALVPLSKKTTTTFLDSFKKRLDKFRNPPKPKKKKKTKEDENPWSSDA